MVKRSTRFWNAWAVAVRVAAVLTLVAWSAPASAQVQDPPTLATTRSTVAVPPEGLSAEAWQAIQAAIERDQYGAQTASDGALEAPNPAQDYRTRFMPDGIVVRPGGADFEVGLRLERWGYGEALEAVPAAELSSDGQRVTYVRGDLEEWYINRPGGIEQGFTVAAAPPRSGESNALRVEMAFAGAAPELTDDRLLLRDDAGVTRLSYGGLVA